MSHTLRMLMLVALAAGPAAAMFAPPQDVPVDRIVKNAEAYVDEHPHDPGGYYVLGRAHYLAWTLKSNTIPVYRGVDKAGKPYVADDHALNMYRGMATSQEAQRRVLAEMGVESAAELKPAERRDFYRRVNNRRKQLVEQGWRPDPVPVDRLDEHARAAIDHFQKALKLGGDESDGLYKLSLGSIIEQYADRAAALGLSARSLQKTDEPAAGVKDQWLRWARGMYREAFERARPKDAAMKHRPIKGIQYLVSYEAIEGFRRVNAMLGDCAEHAALLGEMNRHMKKLKSLRMGAITPIVFSFQRHDGLGDLIDEQAAVAFDLDGMGRGVTWSWVKPGTALLVWDPYRTGRITSGRQLFGSVSWWLMPGDGFRALDLLDDDRDGELAGDELLGLSAWFDSNVNGVSEPGEVVPLDKLPIEALRTRAVNRQPLGLSNSTGMTLDDGATSPLYDWFARPAR